MRRQCGSDEAWSPPNNVDTSLHLLPRPLAMTDDIRLRKVRPIYDAIEAHNFKAAVKLCSRKDLANNPLVKARVLASCAGPLRSLNSVGRF